MTNGTKKRHEDFFIFIPALLNLFLCGILIDMLFEKQMQWLLFFPSLVLCASIYSIYTEIKRSQRSVEILEDILSEHLPPE